MSTKVKAVRGFTAFVDGQMRVFNPGDTGELPDAMARDYYDAGIVKIGKANKPAPEQEPDLSQLDHDGDGEPGGSTSGGDGEDMKALRQEYEKVVGKRAFPGWDADTLRAKMAEAQAEAQDEEEEAGDADEGEPASADPPPPAGSNAN